MLVKMISSDSTKLPSDAAGHGLRVKKVLDVIQEGHKRNKVSTTCQLLHFSAKETGARGMLLRQTASKGWTLDSN